MPIKRANIHRDGRGWRHTNIDDEIKSEVCLLNTQLIDCINVLCALMSH